MGEGGDWAACRAGLHGGPGPNPSGQKGLSILGLTHVFLFIFRESLLMGALGLQQEDFASEASGTSDSDSAKV